MNDLSAKDAFHIHTFRCRHMDDDKQERDYIEAAMKAGCKRIWFTDHAPFEGNIFGFRMHYEELPNYVSTLKELKEEYTGRIEVKIGLEIEYLEPYADYYKRLHDSGNFDVLLLGQHFSWLPKEGIYTFESREKIAEPRELAEGMIAGMETGLFEAAAHPDQIFRRVKEFSEQEMKLAREIKDCAVSNGVSLEINISNMLGKKKKRTYRPEFWKDLPNGLRTIYGLDAHSIQELLENFKKQLELYQNSRL